MTLQQKKSTHDSMIATKPLLLMVRSEKLSSFASSHGSVCRHNKNGKKTIIGSNQQKSNFGTCNTLFFVHSFAVVLHDFNMKLLESSTCSLSLFFSPSLIFILVAVNISHFLTAATKFHVVPPTKSIFCVFSLSLQLFFSLSFAGLSPYFLFFSVFLFLYIPNLWTRQLIKA